MTTRNISKIVRVKNANLEEMIGLNSEDGVYKFLKDKKFEVSETSADGFIETYSNSDWNNERKNTLVFITRGGNFGDHIEVLYNEIM